MSLIGTDFKKVEAAGKGEPSNSTLAESSEDYDDNMLTCCYCEGEGIPQPHKANSPQNLLDHISEKHENGIEELKALQEHIVEVEQPDGPKEDIVEVKPPSELKEDKAYPWKNAFVQTFSQIPEFRNLVGVYGNEGLQDGLEAFQNFSKEMQKYWDSPERGIKVTGTYLKEVFKKENGPAQIYEGLVIEQLRAKERSVAQIIGTHEACKKCKDNPITTDGISEASTKVDCFLLQEKSPKGFKGQDSTFQQFRKLSADKGNVQSCFGICQGLRTESLMMVDPAPRLLAMELQNYGAEDYWAFQQIPFHFQLAQLYKVEKEPEMGKIEYLLTGMFCEIDGKPATILFSPEAEQWRILQDLSITESFSTRLDFVKAAQSKKLKPILLLFSQTESVSADLASRIEDFLLPSDLAPQHPKEEQKVPIEEKKEAIDIQPPNNRPNLQQDHPPVNASKQVQFGSIQDLQQDPNFLYFTMEELSKIIDLQKLIQCEKCRCLNHRGFAYCKKCLLPLSTSQQEEALIESEQELIEEQIRIAARNRKHMPSVEALPVWVRSHRECARCQMKYDYTISQCLNCEVARESQAKQLPSFTHQGSMRVTQDELRQAKELQAARDREQEEARKYHDHQLAIGYTYFMCDSCKQNSYHMDYTSEDCFRCDHCGEDYQFNKQIYDESQESNIEQLNQRMQLEDAKKREEERKQEDQVSTNAISEIMLQDQEETKNRQDEAEKERRQLIDELRNQGFLREDQNGYLLEYCPGCQDYTIDIDDPEGRCPRNCQEKLMCKLCKVAEASLASLYTKRGQYCEECHHNLFVYDKPDHQHQKQQFEQNKKRVQHLSKKWKKAKQTITVIRWCKYEKCKGYKKEQLERRTCKVCQQAMEGSKVV